MPLLLKAKIPPYLYHVCKQVTPTLVVSAAIGQKTHSPASKPLPLVEPMLPCIDAQ